MRARTALTLAVIAALCLGLMAPAEASDPRARKHQVDRALQHLKADMDETSAALRHAANALHAAESKLPAARAKVARVHGQLVAAQARDRVLGEQLQVAKAEVARAQGQIDDTLASIMASHQLIGRIARSSYQDGGMGELAVVLQSQSPDEFATRLVLVQNAMRSEGSVLTGLAESRADLAAQRATLVAKRQQVAGMKRQQEALVQKISGLQAQAYALIRTGVFAPPGLGWRHTAGDRCACTDGGEQRNSPAPAVLAGPKRKRAQPATVTP